MEEKILLGTILQYPDVYFSLSVTEDHFLDNKNKLVFKKIKKLFQEGITPDILSVSSNGLDPAYIASLTNNIAFTNWKYYQDIIIEKAKRYKLKQLTNKIKEWSNTLDSKCIVENIEKEIIEITTNAHTKKIEKIDTLMHKTIEKIETRYKAHGKIPGLSTGLSKLDDYILGLEKTKLYYIGARPSQGKTASMLNIAFHVALNKHKVGILSLESAAEQLLMRALAAEGRINSVSIATGTFKESEFGKLMDICNRFSNTNMFFFDVPNLNISDLIIQTRRMITLYEIEILFIDYLQLVTGGSGDREYERIANVSIALKGLAREYNIPIVCLAQLKRDADNRRPSLGDFSGSSQIEKDADVALLIYHKNEGKVDDKEIIKSYFLIEKNRDGRTGAIPVVFEKEYVSFKEKITV